MKSATTVNYVYQLYYCSQRQVFQEGLPLLLNILTVQLGLESDNKATREPLDPANGPFDFFHLMDLHELATPLMLKRICHEQVFHTIKKGEAFLVHSRALTAGAGDITIRSGARTSSG